MNLIKALKSKKKLINDAQKAFKRVSENNTYLEDETKPYNASTEFENYLKLTDELIDLKVKIHLANAPIYSKIFRLSELKSIVSQLRYLNVRESKSVRPDGTPIATLASINLLERDRLIDKYEAEIETLQEEIEEFNAKTKI